MNIIVLAQRSVRLPIFNQTHSRSVPSVMFHRVFTRFLISAAAIAFGLGSGASVATPITFTDTFTRPDGVVGNGWLPWTGGASGDLVIQNGALTALNPFMVSGVYRPVDYSSPVTITGTFTQTNGYLAPSRYESGFLLGTTGAVSSGYEVLFQRSESVSNNSSVSLYLNGLTGNLISRQYSTFQFESAITPTVTYSPSDGRISGSVTGGGNTFNFDFGSVPNVVIGSNIGIQLEAGAATGGWSNATFIPPTFDNVSITYAQDPPPPPTPISQSVVFFSSGMLPPLPPTPVAGTSIDITPQPSVVLKSSRQALTDWIASAPNNAKTWISSQLDKLEIKIGSQDWLYTQFLKDFAEALSDNFEEVADRGTWVLDHAKFALSLNDALKNSIVGTASLTGVTDTEVRNLIYTGQTTLLPNVAQAVRDQFQESMGKWLAKEITENAAFKFAEMKADAAAQNSCSILGIKTQCLTTILDAASLLYDNFTGVDPRIVALQADLLVVKDFLVPALRQYAHDPVDPDYKSFYLLPDQLTQDVRLTGNKEFDRVNILLLQSAYRAGLYLDAVNRSFDRYTAAMEAGDTASALLQYEAMLYYLDLYKNEAKATAQLISALGKLLPPSPNLPTFDPLWLTLAQQELVGNGLPQDILNLLLSLGYSSSDIETVEQLALAISPEDFSYPTDWRVFEDLAAQVLFSAGVENTVPEGDSKVLVLIALLALTISRCYRRKHHYR